MFMLKSRLSLPKSLWNIKNVHNAIINVLKLALKSPSIKSEKNVKINKLFLPL